MVHNRKHEHIHIHICIVPTDISANDDCPPFVDFPVQRSSNTKGVTMLGTSGSEFTVLGRRAGHCACTVSSSTCDLCSLSRYLASQVAQNNRSPCTKK